MRTSRTWATRALVAFCAVALVASCGGDDDDDDADSGDATSATDEGETVEVTAIDYAFEDLPESVAAGTTFTLHNTADAELHEMVAFKLPEDETRSAAEIAELPEEELGALFAGEPAFVILAPPGEEPAVNAVGDGSVTEPGRYVVFCAIPQGADPEEYMNAPPTEEGPPDVEGGPPHFTLGMVGEFTVE